MPVFRTGIGFDAHRFAASGTRRSLWLACFRWTDDESRGIEGLEGDSDGDVAAHAAIDALLSASNLGDIGTFFGVGENSRASGCSGSFMLSQTADYVAEHGWKTENISISIIGNSPRISAHRDEAAEAMSKAAKTAVTITATTTDTMGFTGRSEGVAAYAVALLSHGERAEKEEK